MKKFTFKKLPKETGLRAIGNAGKEWVDIKLGGINVGSLYKGGFFRAVDIRFQILKDDIMEDGNPNCTWKWVTLKYHPDSIQEAKDFLKKFSGEIQEKFKLYLDKV